MAVKQIIPVAALLLASVFTGCSSSGNINGLPSSPDSRNDKWGFTGAGGGGAMFCPAVSPYDPGYAYVACDMTGSFVTYNAGQTWRMFSLRGPVRYFVFDPVDTNTVYAKSTGLFRSTDRGNTWNIVCPDPSDIKAIVSRGDHAEERIVTVDGTGTNVMAFAVDPGNSMNLHVVMASGNSIAYYTSADQGKRWEKVKDLDGRVSNIFINPASAADNRTVYLTGRNYIIMMENGVWKTNQGPQGTGLLTSFAGGYDRASGNFIIYAISGKSYFNPRGDRSGIFYTDDGGKRWENRQQSILRLHHGKDTFPEWRSVATSAEHPEVVYISYGGLKISDDTTSLGVAVSRDFGMTWDLAWKDLLYSGGYKYSPNYEKGWLDKRFAPTWGENPFAIGVSARNPDVCYATDFGRTIGTMDGGKTWKQLYTKRKNQSGWISRGLEVTTGYAIVADPFDLMHMFIANTDIGLMESHDGGESWNSATKDNGIPRKWMNSTYWLAFDPGVKGRAWAAMSDVHDLPRPKMWRRNRIEDYEGGIVMTEDGGKTWKPVRSDIGESAVTHILVDPSGNPGNTILYACAFGKGVFKSADAGKTWNIKNKGIEGDEPFTWRITRNDDNGELFLVVCRRSDDGSIGNAYDGAVYRSSDRAESWKRIILPEGTNGPMSIMPDPENNDRLLLSAWGRITAGGSTPDTGGGIFLSPDNGGSWEHVLAGDQHIHDLTYDARTGTFYACGFEGSAYRSDDRGQTWKRIRGYNFKWGKRVDPDPHDPGKIYIITFGGGVWHGPANGDPGATEDIVTPVFIKSEIAR
jgi:photosystem II stability/assembly factor-like uncharacterized protein